MTFASWPCRGVCTSGVALQPVGMPASTPVTSADVVMRTLRSKTAVMATTSGVASVMRICMRCDTERSMPSSFQHTKRYPGLGIASSSAMVPSKWMPPPRTMPPSAGWAVAKISTEWSPWGLFGSLSCLW